MSRLYIDQSSRVYVDQSNRLFVYNPVPVIPPLYSLWVDTLTANETTDNTITFYLSAQNINVVDLPMTVPFKVIGQVDENDFLVGTQLSGTFVLSDNNTIASQTFEVLADSTTEGDETMTLILTSVAGVACPLEAQSLSGSVLIYDTSLFPPGYTLSVNPTQANETTSNVFDIKLTTTGVANGTIIPFRMTGVGISAVDFTGVTALTGFFEVLGATVPPNLTPVVTTRTYTITADQVTEGTEVLTVTLSSAEGISCPIEAEGLSKQISISDTSIPVIRPEVSSTTLHKYSFSPTETQITTFSTPTASSGQLIHILIGGNVANSATDRIVSLSSNSGSPFLTRQFDIGNSLSDCHLSLFTKVASGGENQFRITHQNTGSPEFVAWCSFIDNVDQTNPIDVIGTGTTIGASNTTITLSSIQTLTNNCLVFAAATNWSNVSTLFSSASGLNWSNLFDDNQVESAASYRTVAAYIKKIQALAGNTSNVAFNRNAQSYGQAGVQWAIRRAT